MLGNESQTVVGDLLPLGQEAQAVPEGGLAGATSPGERNDLATRRVDRGACVQDLQTPEVVDEWQPVVKDQSLELLRIHTLFRIEAEGSFSVGEANPPLVSPQYPDIIICLETQSR